jgi:hypothetical protein
MNNNKDKFHFYIGNIFDNEDQIRILNKVRKKLKEKYALKDQHWNNKFFSNLIYIGYFDTKTAQMYMDNIITPLLDALSDKINILECNYTGFKIYYDKSFYKISLKFTDNNNQLEDIIIPYLHYNAILPIYEKRTTIYKPTIDIIYYKKSSKIINKSDIKIEIPKGTFNIDHLSLIKGIPVKYRPGTPSTHDQMSFEEITKYRINLNNNNTSNNI